LSSPWVRGKRCQAVLVLDDAENAGHAEILRRTRRRGSSALGEVRRQRIGDRITVGGGRTEPQHETATASVRLKSRASGHGLRCRSRASTDHFAEAAADRDGHVSGSKQDVHAVTTGRTPGIDELVPLNIP
jgi:hypothetical protein